MKTKMLSLAAFAIIAMAGLSGVQATIYDQTKACMENNNDCSKFAGSALAACNKTSPHDCVATCREIVGRNEGTAADIAACASPATRVQGQ